MAYQYELKDIECFVHLARAGSMTRAAHAYNVPKATLSHNLRRLEDALRVELFTRKPNGLELTDAGKEYLTVCSKVFDSCDAAANAAQRVHSSASGSIRIAASTEFGTSIVGAATSLIARTFPQLDFDIQMFPNETLATGPIDFDCMIYVGDAPSSNLMRRKMGEVSSGLYASPSFIREHGCPEKPMDLKALNSVIYVRNGVPEPWTLTNKGVTVESTGYPRFKVNEYWMAKHYTVEGTAIGHLPDFFVHYEVELGALVPILPGWRSKTVSINVIYPPQRHRNPRVMGLVDTLCSNFNEFIRHPGYSLINQDVKPGNARRN